MLKSFRKLMQTPTSTVGMSSGDHYTERGFVDLVKKGKFKGEVVVTEDGAQAIHDHGGVACDFGPLNPEATEDLLRKYDIPFTKTA